MLLDISAVKMEQVMKHSFLMRNMVVFKKTNDRGWLNVPSDIVCQ